MSRHPRLAETRDLLFVIGIAAWMLGLASVTEGFHPLIGEALRGAPALTAAPGDAWRSGTATTGAWSMSQEHFLISPSPSLQTSSSTPDEPTPVSRQRYPGDGIGHRDAMVMDGDGPRFLQETSRLQTRRGWPDAGAVALARFNGGHVPPDPTSSASPP